MPGHFVTLLGRTSELQKIIEKSPKFSIIRKDDCPVTAATQEHRDALMFTISFGRRTCLTLARPQEA